MANKYSILLRMAVRQSEAVTSRQIARPIMLSSGNQQGINRVVLQSPAGYDVQPRTQTGYNYIDKAFIVDDKSITPL